MDTLTDLLPAIERLGNFGYWIVFLVSFLESIAFIGAFIPGALIIVAIGFFSSQGYLHLGTLIWFIAIGTALGDTVSYWLGTKGSRFFKNENRILKASHLDTGKDFFKRHGNKSIFVGRFIGVIRPVLPFTAGILKMNFWKFTAWNLASSFVWAATYLLIGYFFAEAFEPIQFWTKKAGVATAAIGILIWTIWRLLRKKTVN